MYRNGKVTIHKNFAEKLKKIKRKKPVAVENNDEKTNKPEVVESVEVDNEENSDLTNKRE